MRSNPFPAGGRRSENLAKDRCNRFDNEGRAGGLDFRQDSELFMALWRLCKGECIGLCGVPGVELCCGATANGARVGDDDRTTYHRNKFCGAEVFAAHDICGAERDSLGLALPDFCGAFRGDADWPPIYSGEKPGVRCNGEPGESGRHYSYLRIRRGIFTDGAGISGGVHHEPD